MTATSAQVHLVIDDASTCGSVVRVLGATYQLTHYRDFEALLDAAGPTFSGCIVIDRPSGPRGFDLHARLEGRGCHAQIVFLATHGDVANAVMALKCGVDVVETPIDAAALHAAVAAALATETATRARHEARVQTERRAATLTRREHQIWLGVVRGQLNKQIGDALGIVERTVKIHRRSAMLKLGANSVADLVRAADRLGLG